MTESRQSKSHTDRNSRSYPGFVRLFFKQAAVSLVIGILFSLMRSVPVPTLNNCARALGDALRYEMKLPAENLPDWVMERIPFLQ